ncbi:MAG: hypothetical protein LBD42_00140 [Desulfovibrio sp.]|nr:hypothetical protein [Desulfovibrio sp.]
MRKLLDDASLPTDAGALAVEAAELERRLDACRVEIQRLMDEEDPLRGIVHSAAIHQAKQSLMMLRYQRDLRVALLNRIGANDHTPL